MNPDIRHFLPSRIRGVYRFDAEFANVTDDEGYQQFVERKLRFLPCELIEKVKGEIGIAESFDSAQENRTINKEELDSINRTSQRAKDFFRRHPYFKNAVNDNRMASDEELKDAQNYLEIQFVKKILAPLLIEEGLDMVQPQKSVGPYYLDFGIEGTQKIALEIDGFGKFKARADLDDFIKRQNYIVSHGWQIIRFTYSQVMENTRCTLLDLYKIFSADQHMRRFLAVNRRADLLQDSASYETNGTAIETVNNFYRIQDYFVEMMLGSSPDADAVALGDGLGLSFPLVALALSSFYRFMDAVMGLMEVDFNLPEVEVSGSISTNKWLSELHDKITIRGSKNSNAKVFDAKYLTEQSFVSNVPLAVSNPFEFRSGLTPADISAKLEYFCKSIFDYLSTKPIQDSILQRIFDDRSVVGISPTGSGKSFCFWMPAILKPGVTFVIAPLRSLMRDQILTLRNLGIASAEFINCDVGHLDQRRILEDTKLGYIRLLYISPERLRIKKFLQSLNELQQFVQINYLAVDEAHCISEWGHDFRPSYLKLPYLLELLSTGKTTPPLIALTATAGLMVQEDMLHILGLLEDDLIKGEIADRENFSYQVVKVNEGLSKSDKYHDILTRRIPKALSHQSIDSVLLAKNKKREKTLGIVFCVYADPHGKSSIWDGTTHYLFETMKILEPSKIFQPKTKKYDLAAFSSGRVRSFSSKKPTLCRRCNSYAWTSKRQSIDDEEIELDDERASDKRKKGIKVCYHCKKEFKADDTNTPDHWEELIKRNQAEFKNGEFDVLVATKGFGMGIDKSSIRFVLHTSLSSGLESWYQEAGRAGRDGERANIVLMTEPPNERCLEELRELEIRCPMCNYISGCKHGKANLCDYGKQHMFIHSSYPGVETDAMSVLKMLDKLLVAGEFDGSGKILVNSSNMYLSCDEISLYRLMVLGLVNDYVITYGSVPRFDVESEFSTLHENINAIPRIEQQIRACLDEYLSTFLSKNRRTLERELSRCKQEYQMFDGASGKSRTNGGLNQYSELFDSDRLSLYRTVYEYLLVLLDHTYKNIVRMRYDMLWNLLDVVQKQECRRMFLPLFGEKYPKNHNCGCCDICRPSLEFEDSRIVPPTDASTNERDFQLKELFRKDQLDIGLLRKMKEAFVNYSTAKYREARGILEGSPDNLPALFMTREFSSPEDMPGNAKRLLRTANGRSVPLHDVEEIYKTSPNNLKPELLSIMNEADSSCDCMEGWKFLANEARTPANSFSKEAQLMAECLDFFIAVEDSGNTQTLRNKALELEKAFNA